MVLGNMNMLTSFGSSSTSFNFPSRNIGTRNLIDCMEVEGQIGNGTYGVVYRGRDITKPDKPVVALKKIKMEKETQGFPITAIREIKLLKSMNHPNVVKLYEIITYENKSTSSNTNEEEDSTLKAKDIFFNDIFMVFEFIQHDLSILLKHPNFMLTPTIIKSYMHQLLQGVQYLHDNKILHRDIKTANILITSNNVLKIADWGLARSYNHLQQKLTAPVVTLWYRSPELALGTRLYGPEIDIWSVGCVFVEFAIKKTALFPTKDNKESELLELIFRLLGSPKDCLLVKYKSYPDWEKLGVTYQYESRFRQEYGSAFDENALDLIEKLLHLDPTERIKASVALNHPYFTKEPMVLPEDLPLIDLTKPLPNEQNNPPPQAPSHHEVEKKAYLSANKEKRQLDRAKHGYLNKFTVTRVRPSTETTNNPNNIPNTSNNTTNNMNNGNNNPPSLQPPLNNNNTIAPPALAYANNYPNYPNYPNYNPPQQHLPPAYYPSDVMSNPLKRMRNS